MSKEPRQKDIKEENSISPRTTQTKQYRFKENNIIDDLLEVRVLSKQDEYLKNLAAGAILKKTELEVASHWLCWRCRQNILEEHAMTCSLCYGKSIVDIVSSRCFLNHARLHQKLCEMDRLRTQINKQRDLSPILNSSTIATEPQEDQQILIRSQEQELPILNRSYEDEYSNLIDFSTSGCY